MTVKNVKSLKDEKAIPVFASYIGELLYWHTHLGKWAASDRSLFWVMRTAILILLTFPLTSFIQEQGTEPVAGCCGIVSQKVCFCVNCVSDLWVCERESTWLIQKVVYFEIGLFHSSLMHTLWNSQSYFGLELPLFERLIQLHHCQTETCCEE